MSMLTSKFRVRGNGVSCAHLHLVFQLPAAVSEWFGFLKMPLDLSRISFRFKRGLENIPLAGKLSTGSLHGLVRCTCQLRCFVAVTGGWFLPLCRWSIESYSQAFYPRGWCKRRFLYLKCRIQLHLWTEFRICRSRQGFLTSLIHLFSARSAYWSWIA